MKNSLLIAFTVLLSSTSFSQLDTKAIDSIFTDWDNANSPGCSIGVFKDGKTIYARGYGSANLEYAIPNSSTSVFRIGSTSKQFTAACIVLLEQQGKLKFENSLSEYFPDFPDYGKKITVRHLLNHTSGLRDYLTLSYLKGLGSDDYYEDEDIMHWMLNQTDLDFEPGSEFVYCNTGYWLLGQIVGEVTGQSMAEFAAQEIFAPLGMKNTHFHNDHTEIVKNRASGYEPDDDGNYYISMTTLDMIGDGGIFTTIEDIKLWDDAFYASTILNDEFWKEMIRQGELNDGTTINYASGLSIVDYKGLREVSHGGSFVGFKAELMRFPDQKVTIAIFANRADANPTRMAHKVANIVLSDAFVKESEETVEIVQIEEEMLDQKQFIGDYEIQAGVVMTISLLEDSIHILQNWDGSEYKLMRSKGNTFLLPGKKGISFRFTGLNDGFTQILEVNQAGKIRECKRKNVLDMSEINLDEYVGVYLSQELEMKYSISLEEGALQLTIKGSDPKELIATEIDQFSYNMLTLTFIRDEKSIGGFNLDAGRAKNLYFEKK